MLSLLLTAVIGVIAVIVVNSLLAALHKAVLQPAASSSKSQSIIAVIAVIAVTYSNWRL